MMLARRPRWRHFCIGALAVAGTSLIGTQAIASDSFHDCTALDQGAGYMFDPINSVLKGPDGKKSFAIADRQRLKVLSGYCNTMKRRYRYRTEVYGLTLEVKLDDKPKKLRFRCENIEDATPAGLSCMRDVRVLDWDAPAGVFEAYR